MATVFTVTQVTGQAWIRSADGTLTLLQAGMQVPVNARIVTADGASVRLEAEGMLPITIGGGRDVVLSEELLETDIDPAEAAITPTDAAVQQVLNALEEGADPFDTLDSTSALQSASQGGHDGVTFMRMVSLIEITAPMSLVDPRSTSTIDLGQQVFGGLEESRDEFGAELSTTRPPVAPFAPAPDTGGSGAAGGGGSPGTGGGNSIPGSGGGGNPGTGGGNGNPGAGNGNNSRPLALDDDGGQILEDSSARLAGNVISNDVFRGGPVSVSWVGAENAAVLQQLAQYGTISLGANGNWRFALDNSKPATQGLAAGQVIEFNLNYVLSASGGDAAPATLSFRVLGTNDMPVISGRGSGSVQEDAAAVVTGTLNITDADIGEAAFVPGRITGAYGALTIDANGNWLYTLENQQPNVQSLGAGDTATELITVRSVDGTQTQITITIRGMNDAPVITGAKTGALTEDAASSVSGKLNITDVDTGEAAFVAGSATGVYGSLTIDAEGLWTYTLAATSDAQIQALGAGVTATDRITVLSVDGTPTVIEITITGVNDAPVITGAKTGALTEDAASSVSGKLNITDVDTGEAAFVAGSATGIYGSLTIDAEGRWTYTLTATSNAQIQALGAGVTATDVITVRSVDGTETQITITITGVNDVPVITGAVTGAIPEDTVTPITGKLDIIDVDAGESAFIAGSITGTYGSLTIDAQGNWVYTLANNQANVQSLSAGQTETDQFTVLSADGTPTVIEITITGTNDDPQISGVAHGAVQEDGVLKAEGQMTVSDVDTTDTHTWSIQGDATGAYGSIVVDPTGKWIYTLDNTLAQNLAANETHTESFAVQVSDGQGGTDTQTIIITVTGTNDAPVLTVDAIGSITEDASSPMLSDSGTLSIADLDVNDTHTLSSSYNNDAAWSGGTLTADQVAAIQDGLTVNTGGWTYEVANSAVQFLGAGQTLTLSFDVTVTDSADASHTQTVTITITGTNDDPEISGVASGAVQEDGLLQAEGQLAVSDVDTTDTHTWSIQGDATGRYGSIVVDAGGKWTYTLDNSLAQSLAVNETHTETFTVEVDDGKGGIDTHEIVITITGTNDRPVVTADTGATDEDSILTVDAADGLLANDYDPDGDALTVREVNGALTDVGREVPGSNGGIFIVNIDGSYTFKPGSDFQYLGQGQDAQTSITYTVSDGKGGLATSTLTVTVTGTNDAPTITGARSGEVTEDTSTSITGKLDIVDVDAGEAAFQAADLSGAYGALSIDAQGNWTYTLANDQDNVQSLGEGVTATDRITVRSADGTPTEIEITITGTNDNPEISGVASGAVQEDGTLTAEGQLIVSDVDTTDTHTWSIQGETAGQYGSIVIDADGKWTYVLDNESVQNLAANETRIETFTVQVVDDQGGTDTQTITITITGTNDRPVVTADVGATDEDTILTVDAAHGVLANDYDPDGDTLTVREVNGAFTSVGREVPGSNGGIFVVDADGSYTFKPGSDFQFLGEGANAQTSITYTVSDDQGGTITSTLTVTVTGTNDAPAITGAQSGEVTEDTATMISGKLAIDDVDVDESSFQAGDVTGVYGSLTIDADGSWTYTLANEQVNVQSLGAGDTATDLITVFSADGTPTVLEITITGTNDVPEITGAKSGEVTEDTGTSVTGKLAIDDVDVGESSFQAGDLPGVYGSLTIDAQGNWTYTLANDQANVQSLGKGDTATDRITVLSADGTPTEIEITITGTNDDPEISGVAYGAVQEDGVLKAEGQLTVSDIDATDTHTWSIQGDATGTYGSIVVDQDGKWTYTLDNSLAQSLAANETYTESFTVEVDDGKGGTDTQEIVITITGTNDRPVVTADIGATDEDTILTVDAAHGVLANDYDPDGDALTVREVNGAITDVGREVPGSNGGIFVILPDGSYTFRPGSDFQFLGQSQDTQTSIRYTVSDGKGGLTTSTLTVTVTGTNDAPVLTVEATGALTEGVSTPTLSDSGTLNITDLDVTDTHTLSSSYNNDAAWSGGTLTADQVTAIQDGLTVNASGWTYEVANSAVQFLGAGQTLILSFDVTVTDSAQGTDTQTVTITITGTNDDPEISGVASGAVQEDGTLTAEGQLTVSDVDATDTHTWSISGNDTGQYGSIAVDVDGKWTYTLDNARAQSLAADETYTETFTVQVADGQGGIDTQTITITITGTNDDPEISGVAHGAVQEDGVLKAEGQLTVSDADASDMHTWSIQGDATGAYGSIVVEQDGKWTYTLDNTLAQSLAANETYTETFAVQVADSQGGTDTHEIVITITGTNDRPVVTADTGATDEDSILTVDAADGLLANDYDPDGDALTVREVNGAITDVGREVPGSNGGIFIVNADGSYTFKPGSDFQFLGQGQDAQTSITYTVSDGNGGLAISTLTVTVTGTNDAPVLTVEATGALTEDASSPTLSDSGALSITDLDVTDNHTLSSTYNNDAAWSGGSLTADQVASIQDGLTVNAGGWTYEVANSAVQFLGAGQTLTLSFDVTVTDSAQGTDTQTVTITITGTNDDPEISGVASGAVQEDGVLKAEGQLTVSDVDASDTHTWSIQGDVKGAYGSIVVDQNGKWTYTLDNARAQSLAANEAHTESFVVQVADNQGGIDTQTITLTITGTNDEPVLTVSGSGSIAEDAHASILSVEGALSVTDLDVNDTHTLSSSYNNDAAWSGGTLTVDQVAAIQSGLTVTADSWTYEVANSAVQFLGAGQTLTLSFDVTVTDSDQGTDTQTVTITITGTNDDPQINGVASGAVQEDGTLTAEGQLTVSDADTTDTHTWSISGNAAGQYGLIAVDVNGKWIYTLDNARAQSLAADETYTETFTVQVADSQGGTDTQTVTITITGTNDDPTISGVASGAVQEDGTFTAVGQLTVSDADATDEHAWSVQGDGQGAYGSLAIDAASGKWTYVLDNESVQSLAANETRTETFTVQVADGQGGIDTQTITITITGTNDAPAITGATTGAVTEDTATTITGKLYIVDMDAGESAFQAESLVGTYGSLFIDAEGNWTYTLANKQANVQSLGAGATVTEQITVRSADGTESQITITITGTNDDPEISGVASGAVQEDGVLKAEGQLTVSDADATDTHTWSIQGDAAGRYGSIVVDADGKWIYTLDNTLAQGLAANETRTETFAVQVADGQGGTDTHEIVITITGTNDRPVVTADTGATDEGTVLTVGAANGVLANDDDPDGDTLTVREVNGAITDVGREVPGSNGGIFVVNADGSYTFKPGSDFQFLGQGQDAQTSITYTVSDGNGGLAISTLTVTVTGTNDAPVLTVEATGALTEDASSPTLSDSGALSITDLDVTDTHTLSSSYNNDAAWSGGTLTADQVAAIQDGLTVNAGGWTYEVANSAVQFLGAGQTLTLSFDVTVTDSALGTDTQTVTITITGTNDTPTITGASSGEVTEDTATSITGKLDIVDVDAGESVFEADTLVGTYGSLTIDAEGNWTYTLANDQANVQSLGEGATATDRITVLSADGTPTEIVITITGANDAPTITGTLTGAVAEDDIASASGKLNIVDADTGESAFVAETVVGTYGSLTIDAEGNWTYTLVNDQANVQSLGAGDTAIEQITVLSADGTETQIEITITGTNDDPEISGVAHGAVQEDSVLKAEGQLTVSDVDATDEHTWSVQGDGQGEYGGLTVDTDGKWSYTLDNALAQSLAANETHTETFTVQVADGQGGTDTQTITITVTGTNNAPVLTVDATGSLTEDASSPMLSDSGTLSIADLDVNDTHTLSSSYNNDAAWSGGTLTAEQVAAIQDGLTVNTGGWTYEVANSAVQFLGAGQTLTLSFDVTVTDSADASHTQTVTITITGTNDDPEISGVASGAVREDGTLTAEGQLTVSDADATDEHAWSVQGDGQGDYGRLSVDADGKWTYVLDNESVQSLAANETYTETFTVEVDDGQGGTDTQEILITITGTNDRPIVTADTGATDEETVLTVDAANGVLANDYDPDGDALTVNKVNGAATDVGREVPGSNGGIFVINADGSYIFKPGSDFQFLAVDQFEQTSITYTVSDGQGGTSTATLTVTVTGTNDAPEISGVASGAVQEDGMLTAEGQLTVSDADATDEHVWSVQGDGQGDYGRLAVDAAGKWTYTLDNESVQSLAANETRTETFTVQVADGQGGTDTQTIIITVTGTNDDPVLTVDGIGSITEDASSPMLSDSGALNITDLDVTDTHTLSSSYNDDAAWSGGTLTADQVAAIQDGLTVSADGWTYEVANSAVQFLGAGQTLTLSFDVAVTDSALGTDTQTVTITITGTNDDPEISGVVSGAVQEDGTLTAEGQLTVSDADTTDTHTWSISGNAAGQYGSIAVDVDGKWIYTLDNARAQSLAADETYTETFTVQVDDGQGGTATETVTITVTGTNDAPIVEGGQAYASGFEDALLQLSWSQFNITDVDSADATLGVVITGLPADGVLFFDGAAVAAGQTISKADIDAGKLTFKPDANESGFDSHPGTGVGDQQQDYAQFAFKPTDGITEGENTNFIIDVHPISDAPNVTVTVTQGDSQPATGGGGEIIRVNGGSDAINGLGFDVVDGKIYAIGENVRIWYTNARTGSTKDGSVVHHQDFTAEEIQQIIENSLSGRNLSEAQRASLAAQMQGNFIPYTQGNANAGDAGKGKTDVFVLHENSLYEQNAQTDNQGTTYHSYSMNAGSGNGGNGNSSDFIFLKETAGVTYKVDGVVSHEWHVNEPNHNDNWTITANGKSIVSGFNQLAGLVTSSGGYFGSSGLVVPADDAPASPGYVEYEVTVVAHVSDQDGSERMGQEIVLSGLPAGSTVILANGQELIVGADGTVILVGEFSNFEGRVGEQTQVSSEITIRVPQGSSFELQAEAKAYETALGEQSAASGYGGSEIIAVPDVTEPGESGQPGDSGQPGGEQPGEPEALGMPTVNVTATSQGIEPGSVGITQVNGGARNANGFDIENGQIVRIGSGVVVWLSRGDVVPTDSNGHELSSTQVRYYDSVNGTISGHKNYTDIFVLHEDSDLHGKVQGNRSGSHSDYVFVPDDGTDYSVRAKTSAQGGGAGHNPLNQVFLSIEGSTNDFARADLIKGVIFGSGVGHEFGEAGPGDAITTIGAGEGYQRVDVTLTAAPQDAGREELLPELFLTGIPAGVQVYDAAGQLLSAGVNGAYVLSAERLVQNPDGSFSANISVRVPENAEAFDLAAHATAKLIGDDSGRSETAFGEASISYGMDVSDPSTGDPIDYGADLLLNGDFTLYKGTPGWEEGNIYQGFREWNHVGGNFSGDEYKRMEDRPYIGVWENTARDIALTQAVEGVVAGSVVQLQVAWNNPNHGEPGNGISKPPQDTGDSMTLEISFGGVVYAQIATPSANMSVADARYAHVIGMNGATVDLDQIQTWSEQYGWYGGNTPKPDDLNVFETLNITLPPGVAGSGEFSLRWISQDEGSPYTDDIMVANVKLLLPDAPATFSALATDDTEAFGSLLLASPEEETLFGTSGDDTFMWNDDDAGTKADPITHVVKNFGLGGDDLNGQDALDLSDLLQGEEDGTLTNYLHLESEESNGVTNTVIKVDKDGAGFSADAGGHDHRIVLENVDLHDLTGGGSQNDMLQQMIADGKLKVDQG